MDQKLCKRMLNVELPGRKIKWKPQRMFMDVVKKHMRRVAVKEKNVARHRQLWHREDVLNTEGSSWREKKKRFRVFILKGICCSIKNVIHFQVVFYLVKKNMKATCFVVFSHLLTFFFSQSTSCDFASFSSAHAPHTTRVANVWTRCMRRSLESWYRCKIHHRRSHFASYR